MGVSVRLLVIVLALAVGDAALAQERQGFLGVDLQDITKAEAEKLGWEAPRGAKVVKPREGGPAAGAGILAEDVIVSLDGQEVESMERFVAAIGAKGAGAQVRLRLLRLGKERTITVTLGQRPAELAQKQPEKRDLPILQLDPGGHMARINSLAFTPDGKLLISAADDKVMRVWDWQAGKTVRTIRGQVGPGPEGKIYAMALSPNGRWLAAGGWTDPITAKLPCCGDIRLHDFANGALVALLKGHTSVVNSLAFSPDGKQLISGSGLGDLSAIIWDVESRKLFQRLKEHKASINSSVFTPDGARAVTGSHDTTLRLWRVSDGGLIAEMTGHTQEIRRGVTVRSSDGMIASGDASGEIRLWDGKTGQFLRTLANQKASVGALAFSPDGKWLVSGNAAPRGPFPVRTWEVATGKETVTYTKHDNIVVAMTVSPDGHLVATGGFNGDVQVWDLKTGETKHRLAGTGAPVWSAGFSPDGRRFGWGHRWSQHDPARGYGPVEFVLPLPEGSGLGRPELVGTEAASAFVRARATHGTYTLAHLKGGTHGYDAILEVKKDGQTVASIERNSTNGYQHRNYSFTPDGQTIISGGDNGFLSAYDLKGQRLGDFVGHESDVWGVAPSPDGRLLVSGSADQTVRLWNLKTREPIVTLFRGTDGEWVMWTPQGYYTGSPGADKIVGWQINKGPDQAADYVGADQLRQHLNRPDIVEKAIILASAEQAVREAPGTTFTLADLLKRPVPRFRILSPAPGSAERGGRAIVRIALEATPDPVKAIRVQVNGLQVEERTPDIGSGGFKPGEEVLDVPLGSGRNEVRITLANAIGDKAETLSLTHEGEGALDRRGTLYILAIGVDKYPGLGKSCGANGDASCDLKFSGADARALVAATEKRLGPAHTRVVKRILVNGAGPSNDPTATNILDAIDLLKQAQETDTVLLFIAGHGFNDGPNYRFLATNAERIGDAFRGATVVPWQILQEAVETAKGRRVLFIDPCHAGNAYNQRLGNAAYHANIIAYTAARFDQEAMEDTALGHGLFTYAVVEGLDGRGGLDAKRQISTKELAAYVVKRVEELAKSLKGEQEPQYFKGRDAQDYVLARW